MIHKLKATITFEYEIDYDDDNTEKITHFEQKFSSEENQEWIAEHKTDLDNCQIKIESVKA